MKLSFMEDENMLIGLICVSVYAIIMTVAFGIVKYYNNKIVKEVLNLKKVLDTELEKLDTITKEAQMMAAIEEKLAKKFEYNSNPLHSDLWSDL